MHIFICLQKNTALPSGHQNTKIYKNQKDKMPHEAHE